MPTALVTGASSGIGLAFARALASSGYDLVVVARDTQRLDALAKEVGERDGVAVEVLTADLTDGAQRAAVEARLADDARPVDLLVNNAGFGGTVPVVERDPDDIDREIRLNVLALTRLTRAVLPAMLARKQGGIVLVSSVASFQPTPKTAVYAGTKAYVTIFGESLHEELRGTGVRVTTLCPGFTRTEFQERNRYDTQRLPGMVWQTPEQVVEAGLAALRRNQALCVPGVHNKALVTTSHFLPRGMVRRIAGFVVRRL
jgi:short-subunit dehydrogenase